MNWTTTEERPVTAITTTVTTMLNSNEDLTIDSSRNLTLLYNNSSSSTAVTTYLNSSDVLLTVNGLDSLMNVLIAMVLVVLILTTAIGKCFLLGADDDVKLTHIEYNNI
jgi:hypothetical protein